MTASTHISDEQLAVATELVEELYERFGIVPLPDDTEEARMGRLRVALNLCDVGEAPPTGFASVRVFWAEHRDRFAWDMLPGSLLMDAYRAWCGREGIEPLTKGAFLPAMDQLVDDIDKDWTKRSTGTKTRPAKRMTGSDPVVEEYQLERWLHGPQAPNYSWCLLRRKVNAAMAEKEEG